MKPNSFMKPSGEDGLSGCWDRELACWAPPGPNHHTKPTRGKVMSGFSYTEVGPSFVLLWQNALHLLKSMFTFHCWFERETMTITFHLLLNMFYFSPVGFKENLSLRFCLAYATGSHYWTYRPIFFRAAKRQREATCLLEVASQKAPSSARLGGVCRNWLAWTRTCVFCAGYRWEINFGGLGFG